MSLWPRLRRRLPAVLLLAIAAFALLRALRGAAIEPAEGGKAAPSFTLRDVRGQARSLESFRGKPVLVNFWATWCPPCRMEMPALEELSRAHEGCLTVLGVTEDGGDPAAVAKFLSAHGVTYPVLLDDGSAGAAYGVSTIPHSVLLDAKGRILGTFDGIVTKASVERALAGVTPVC